MLGSGHAHQSVVGGPTRDARANDTRQERGEEARWGVKDPLRGKPGTEEPQATSASSRWGAGSLVSTA